MAGNGQDGHGHDGHNHGHGGCSCEHQDANEGTNDAERGNLFSLYLKIDSNKVQCLNESVDGSGRLVFKPWDERLDKEKFVESDVDEELLFNIPFTGSVKLKGVIVIGAEDDSHPAQMKLYKNRPNMTFDDVGSEPEQEFELVPDSTGVMEYVVKAARFNSVNELCMYFPKNFGAETSKIYYIGLRGDFTEFHRHAVTIATYEARANPADHHKTNTFDSVSREVQ